MLEKVRFIHEGISKGYYGACIMKITVDTHAIPLEQIMESYQRYLFTNRLSANEVSYTLDDIFEVQDLRRFPHFWLRRAHFKY